jgi:hypothetical protein
LTAIPVSSARADREHAQHDRKIRTIVALAAASLLAGAAAAQDAAPPVASIIVIGEGRVQAAPDTFSMNAEVEGRGADQAAAVLQMTALQAAVTDQVTRLEGGDRLTLYDRASRRSSLNMHPPARTDPTASPIPVR